jgi:ribosomal protein S5
MVRATVEAFVNLRSPEEVAEARGKQLAELDIA